jgi:hypothetical protein
MIAHLAELDIGHPLGHLSRPVEKWTPGAG